MRFLAICLVSGLAACSATTGATPDMLDFRTQNDSGVAGTVTLTAVGEDRTLVEVDVDPTDHPDMPAHVHPGTCDDMVPQPMFPLENVLDGASHTEIPISLTDLRAETVALNLHHSNDQMRVSVACIEL